MIEIDLDAVGAKSAQTVFQGTHQIGLARVDITFCLRSEDDVLSSLGECHTDRFF